MCASMQWLVHHDSVHGELVWDLVQLGKPIPYDVYQDIHDAIKLLHSNEPVFGDLRTPNIVVVPNGSGSDTRCRSVLIDFDWVGTHGIGRYPASLDTGLVDWMSGIKRYGIMDKAHDIAMLNKFKYQLNAILFSYCNTFSRCMSFLSCRL